MEKYKTKAIVAYSDISNHIQPRIIRHIQVYSERCVTLTYQNLGIFRTLAERFAKIVNIMYEINIMNFFNIGVIFTTIVFILRKKAWAKRTPVGMDFDVS